MRRQPNSWNKTLAQLGFRRPRSRKLNRQTHALRQRRVGMEPLEDRRVLSLTPTADIVFLVDESSSNTGAELPFKNWLTNIATTLNDELELAGITDNRYGLVGFGESDNSERAHTHLVDPLDESNLLNPGNGQSGDEDTFFGTPQQFSTAAAQIVYFGADEDGWDASEHAIAEYDFREGAVVLFVLFQNEDGRNLSINPSLTQRGILSTLDSSNVVLNVIVETRFDPAPGIPALGNPVIGVEADKADGTDDSLHTAYVFDPLTEPHFEEAIFPDNGNYIIETIENERTEDEYVRLAWDTEGAAWNINVLEEGTDELQYPDRVEGFTAAFVDSLKRQILREFPAGRTFYGDGERVLELNVGGPTIGTYESDATYVPPNTSIVVAPMGEQIDVNSNSIPPNAQEDLFKTARKVASDNMSWNFPSTKVPNGTYVVELFFAEIEDNVNFPVFDVVIEGEKMLFKYGIYNDWAKIGSNANSQGELQVSPAGGVIDDDPAAGVVKRFQVDVTDGNGMQLDLQGSSGGNDPLISAIRILEKPSGEGEDVPGSPGIEDVIIGGSQSTHLNPSYSYADTPDVQTLAVPFGGVDTITIVFSEPVQAIESDLSVVSLQSYSQAATPVIESAHYSGPNQITWKFVEPFVANRYQIQLSNSITDLAMNPFDVDCEDPDNCPLPASGEGPEAKYLFNISVLPDFNRDGVVDLNDYDIINMKFLTGVTFAEGDFTGDGVVDFFDFAAWRNYHKPFADFNSDNVIDGADFLIWESNVGMASGATRAHGDGDEDGDVDGDDLKVWQFHFEDGNADFDADGNVDDEDFAIWDAHYGTSVLTQADGDANGDGFVDDEDLLVWLRDFGNGLSPPLSADFDGSTVVDGSDYIAWQTNFGATSGATLAQGDADGDTDVDLADFFAWQIAYGETIGSDIWMASLFSYRELAPGTILISTLLNDYDGNYSLGDLSFREAVFIATSTPQVDALVYDPALFASGPGAIWIYGTDSADVITIDNNSVTIDTIGGIPIAVDIANATQVTVFAENGSDTVTVDSQVTRAVTIFGGAGNDTLTGGSGSDTLSGEAGNDVLYGNNGNDTLRGGSGTDTLRGGSGNDTLYGGYGNDYLYGEDDNDTIYGDDSYHGYGGGHDLLDGGRGNDQLTGERGNDQYVFSGSVHLGSDTIFEAANVDTDRLNFYNLGAAVTVDLALTGVQAVSTLLSLNLGSGGGALTGIENVTGTQFNDFIYGNARNNHITGNNGADRIETRDGADTIYGGAGADTIYGGNGNDLVYGGDGDDWIFGQAGNDIIYGLNGNDIAYGGTGDDLIFGGFGNDMLYGNEDADILWGEEGIDTLVAGGDPGDEEHP